jgi:hypothetical protein
VHRPLGEQHQDGGTNVTSTTASAVTAAAGAAAGRTEAGTEATGAEALTEASAEARTEAGAERAVVTSVVTANMIAELASGLPALLSQGVALVRAEAEVRGSGPAGKWSAHMGPACFKEWVVHGLISFLER